MRLRVICSWAGTIAVTLAGVNAARLSEPALASQATNSPSLEHGPPSVIQVEPRVELLSILFRLAGNSEYNQGKVDTYTSDVEKQFGAFRGHPAVKLARELRQRRGVSYDACMSMAVHLRNARELTPLVELSPWPEGLDRRWGVSDATNFLAAARQFVQETAFLEFLERHRPLYGITESRLKALMEKEGHLEWFREFFGDRPQATFIIAPALLNGGCCYGAHCRESAGREQLYCILGVWKTDGAGLPVFTRDMLGTVVHEFGHSYANQVVDRHAADLKSAGDELYRHVAGKMRSQAYGDSRTMLKESLVRACEVRYAFRYDGPAAGRRAIANHKGRGFLWMEELSNLFSEYEAHRDQFPTLETFAPRLARFFTEYAQGFSERQMALDGKRPKISSMSPANGAADVDPDLTRLQVVFDRPMKDGSWALVGGGPHCPQTTGKAQYNTERTTWTVPVKLKPNWSYEFKLNSETYDAFRSAEGVPLEPVTVTFRTAGDNRKPEAPNPKSDAEN